MSGKFIPASQRPDGTWRKARRVKDGYVPQEEVPLYESKGKQFTKKPDLPVGMCPLIAKAAQEQRAKQQQKQNKVAAAATSRLKPSETPKKASKKPATTPSKSMPSASTAAVTSTPSIGSVAAVTESLACLKMSDEDVQKQLKKLRKKIREIEAIEEKLNSGDLKQPEQDQLDKVSRKPEILRQIAQLEEL